MFRSRHWVAAARASRRMLRVAALSVVTSAGALGLALCLEACGADETSGQRIVLDTRVELVPGAQRFVTARGWSVELSRVLISTGPFYYFDGAPPIVQRSPRREQGWPSLILGVREAFAHPGHYKAGDALGQMLRSWSVDLLAGAAELPAGEGVTGVYRSASFSFTAPPEGPMAGALEAHAAVVEGVAQREGVAPLPFVATADLPDIERSAADGFVDGCEFVELDITGSGRVTVQVTPKVWFDLVDFAELAPGAAAEPTEFPADSQPKLAFALGLAQLSAYEFSFSAQ